MPNAINELSTELPRTTSNSINPSNNDSTFQPENPKVPKESPDSSHLTTGRLETFDSTTKTATVIPIPSFTVLNNDTLAISGKPNAIVRPIRRTAPAVGPPDAPDNYTPSEDGRQEVESFAKALNRKLRRLRNVSTGLKSSHLSKDGSTSDAINKRPLFISTVPTGVFLPPAKETPILPSKRLYAFATHPRVYSNSDAYKDKLDGGDTTKGADTSFTTTRLHGIRAVGHFPNATKKRDTTPPCEAYKNLMFDRRVVRGTNFAPPVPWNPYFAYAGLLSGKPEEDPCMKLAEYRRRQCLRLRCKQRNQRNVIGTPPAVEGRRHERVQTEKYLEELYERPPEYDVNTQTDLFLERPKTPPFIPEKVGIDVGTEILDGELFDFDREVQPILETLVGHCVEQGILEVTHEEEVADLRKKQEEFLAERERELCELRRLEAEELRLQGEKERRARQDKLAKELDAQMQKGVTAAKLLQGHIASLLPEVLSNLEPATDEARKSQLEKNICPWLTKEVAEEVGHIIDSREILTEIIREIVLQRACIYMDYKLEEPNVGEEEVTLEECKPDECQCQPPPPDCAPLLQTCEPVKCPPPPPQSDV